LSQPLPSLLVIAGPNGSGKSTLTEYLIEAGVDFGEYINPDVIAAALDAPEPERSRRAQAIADHHRDRCLSNRISFSFETVMSHPSKVDVMIRAVEAGYDVTVYFVCTSDPEINVRRVENRVSMGGHDVPRERIVARYWRTLDLLCHAALVARRTVLFDNSALVGYRANSLLPNPKNGLRPVAEVTGNGKDYEITLGSDAPAWVEGFLVRPLHELARSSDGGITLTISRRKSPLA
jgi:predicted ABC-type ATPase